MTESKICTCPSGDGSLRHPCPAHPAVEQVGGDERAAFEAAASKLGIYTCNFQRYTEETAAHENRINARVEDPVRVGDYRSATLHDCWKIWQEARAALAQPSPVHSSLLINGYQLRAALDFIAPDGTAEQLESEACIEWRQQDADFLEAGLYAFCAEYPEEGGVLLDEEPTNSQPSPAQELAERGTQHRFSTTEQTCRHDFAGVWWNDNGETKTGKECRECGFFIADIAEAPELERPEVVGYLATAEHPEHGQPHKAFNYFKDQHDAQVAHWRERGCTVTEDRLMTVAQHERIVGELRADRDSWAEQAEQRLADWDEMRKERAAALARVAELESKLADAKARQELAESVGDSLANALEAAKAQHSAGYAEARQCVNCRHIGINDAADYAACHDCRWTGPEPDEDKCPGCGSENCMAAACPECGGRYELVAETDISAPPAQAQHSVPDHAELLQALERTHAGHMVGHDQSDQPKGGYSDGYVNGFGECIKVARKVLAAAPGNSAQHSVPEGYALIPVRETEAMHDAVMALLYKGVARTDTQKLLDAYIAAAPGKEVGHE
ncbi:hypothetical protein R2388_000381 [Pseudomonas aeruginosa]|nr:hypothetical protein [Pseudomonas aeruginosa]